MEKYLKMLPEEIVNRIIQYTYNPQSAILLEDIRNYSYTLHIIGKVYYERWIIGEHECEPEDRNWLANDIHLFITRDDALNMTFITDILSRHVRIRNDLHAIRYFTILDRLDTEHELRVYWGLMTPDERQRMMAIYSHD